MKCPKCGTTMRHETGGYFRANTETGFGAPLFENFSCIMCGYYVESIPEKNVAKNLITKNNYPKERQAIGTENWLQEYVKTNIKTIEKLRAEGLYWTTICKRLGARDNMRLLAGSMAGVYKKVRVACS